MKFCKPRFENGNALLWIISLHRSPLLQVTDNANVNEKAKSFVVEWADACKYQVQLKYHHMGDGPTAQKVRWSFESAIKYIIICATTLADNDEEEDFKKEVSNYVKNIIIQSLIDALENVKVNSLFYFIQIICLIRIYEHYVSTTLLGVLKINYTY